MREVVIVGGGPVGILLGCLLAVRGVDVEVLEQRSRPSMRSRAIGIHPPSLRVLEQIGVADELMARAVRIRGGVVLCDGRTLGRLSFAEAAGRYPFVVALPQYETEALLRARFEQLRPGALRQGVTVRGVRDRGDHVELTTPEPEFLQGRPAEFPGHGNGVCRIPPPFQPEDCICILIFEPVCGCDGQTYSNSCFASCEVLVWTEGACDGGGTA